MSAAVRHAALLAATDADPVVAAALGRQRSAADDQYRAAFATWCDVRSETYERLTGAAS